MQLCVTKVDAVKPPNHLKYILRFSGSLWEVEKE